jgi:predicted small lipoprotein YifL
MRKIIFALVIITLLAGCGKKGVLIPPESLLPAPVNDLRVIQKGESFQLSWAPPSREAGGRSLHELTGFRVFKREVLPPDEDCEACANAYTLLKSVFLDYLQGVRRYDDHLLLSDADVIVGKTYQYKLVSFIKDGTAGHDSNKARCKKAAPPPAPLLKAVFSPTDISLSWHEGFPPINGRIIGYNIYRRRADELPALAPLNNSPIPGDEYDDLRLERGVTYIYSVRTVAEVDGVLVESEPSNEIKGTLAEPD